MAMNSIRVFIEKIENNKQISFGVVFLLVYTSSFLRGFFEGFANMDNQNRMTGVIDSFFHYPFWFFMGFILTFILLRLFTGEKIEKVSRLGAMFSWLVVLSPIVDLIVYRGGQVRYAFIVGSYSDLAQSFFSFLGGIAGKTPGATFGMKVEVLLGLLGIGYYVFYKTKKISRAFFCALALYAAVFFFLSLPAFIFAAKNAISENPQPVTYQTINYFYSIQEPADSLTKDRSFVFENNNNGLSATQSASNQYSVTVSIIFLTVDILLLGWWFWLYSAKKFVAVVKNFRFVRIAHYFLTILLGIYLAVKFFGHNPIGSLFDFTALISLFMCMLFSWLFSVWENDEVDMEIDKISNPDRPFTKGILEPEEWRNLKYLFLFLSLSFAFLGGFYLLIFALLFLIFYHLYSASQFRLKRFFGISSLIIALNALIGAWMGFFVFAGTENFRAFPIRYTFGILAIFFLLEPIKNLKDVEGDKKEGIQTLPVLFGLKRGKIITGVFAFFASLLLPVIFYLNLITFFTAVIFGLALFFVINVEKFKEKYASAVYFIFMAVFIGEAMLIVPAHLFDAQANRAAAAGWVWLSQKNDKSDPGISFIIKTINDKYCGSSKAEIFWKNILKESENHSYLPVFERLTSNKAEYKKISDKALLILKTPQTYYNDVLPQAIYCDLYPVRKDFAANAFDKIETETGYDLTHKFWSAVLFKENGCSADGYNLDEVISVAANKMAADQEASAGFDDLYAERTAFLEYYGFKNLVKEDWVKKIIDNQLKSGSWGKFLNGAENSHITALSVWALSEYSATCPFKE